MKSQTEVAQLFREVFENEILALRAAGQAEYAHADTNAFGNFERVSADLGIDRKLVLWTYLRKHIDGITAYLRGHKSQREDVRGRINDAITYLFLLRGMIEDEDGWGNTGTTQGGDTITQGPVRLFPGVAEAIHHRFQEASAMLDKLPLENENGTAAT